MIFLSLFCEFFKVGLFAIGGGLATYPFLVDLSERTGWFSLQQLADMLAVSESTPGPIGVNMATYVGFTCGGVPGAVIATLGLITPCVIVILVIAKILQRFRQNRLVDEVFYGLRAASVAMIAAAGLGVLQIALLRPEVSGLLARIHWPGVALAAILLLLTRWKKTKDYHPVIWILLSAAVGIVFRFGGA